MMCHGCLSVDPLLRLVSGLCEPCRGVEEPAAENDERAAIRAKGLAATDSDVRAYHLLGRPERDLSPDELADLTVWRAIRAPATEPQPARYEAGGHVGSVGTRVEVRVTVTKVAELEPGDYGRRFLCRMRTADGDDVVWFTGEGLTLKEQDDATIRGTVKEHGAYLGRKQTVVQRVKVTEFHNRPVEEARASGGIDWDAED